MSSLPLVLLSDPNILNGSESFCPSVCSTRTWNRIKELPYFPASRACRRRHKKKLTRLGFPEAFFKKQDSKKKKKKTQGHIRLSTHLRNKYLQIPESSKDSLWIFFFFPWTSVNLWESLENYLTALLATPGGLQVILGKLWFWWCYLNLLGNSES